LHLRDFDAQIDAGNTEVRQFQKNNEATLRCWRSQYGGVKIEEA
jgi:hypothetical protein